jgi:2,4-dienoyl-CoA reductase (NADPH2)
MGSEGYLLNQFLTTRGNERDDAWGGDFERRMRFPLEVVRRTRERVGANFIIRRFLWRDILSRIRPGRSGSR